MNDVEVTKREVLFSVIIMLAMICLGFFIEGPISNGIAESNETYYKAVKIDNNSDQFKYGMSTNIGNALVYGEFSAVDDIFVPELVNGYFAINRVTERYTEHTRTVETEDSDGNITETIETYYSWDDYSTDKYSVDKFSFLGCEFDVGKIKPVYSERLKLNNENINSGYIDWLNGNYLYKNGYSWWTNIGDLRYRYHVVPKSFMGSMMVRLKEGSMYSIDGDEKSISVLYDKTTAQVIESKEKSEQRTTIVFWIVWMILTLALIIAFTYFENYWLEEV